MPYRYQGADQDPRGDEDAYARRPRQTTPMQAPAIAPPPPVQPVAQGVPPVSPTFAQMQASGQARPPSPTVAASGGNGVGIGIVPPSAIPGGGVIGPDLTSRLHPGGQLPRPGGVAQLPPPPPPTTTPAQTGPNFNVLEYILNQLASGYTNPYDSAAVKSEYDRLAQGIDDQYATNQRTTNNSFARQGLYGSAGKDFNSGRLADLNIGQRTAKTALASDLAQKYADTAAAFQQAQNQRSMDWLRTLMGFGQQAFENDITTNELNRRADESERDYLLRIMQLANGGGV